MRLASQPTPDQTILILEPQNAGIDKFDVVQKGRPTIFDTFNVRNVRSASSSERYNVRE